MDGGTAVQENPDRPVFRGNGPDDHVCVQCGNVLAASMPPEYMNRKVRVREGSGGMTSLGDDDKANIEQTIDDEVLKGGSIEFRSTACDPSPEGDRVRVSGELELAGRRAPITFELSLNGEQLSGSAILKQTDFGMKPYSALFGTLKVLDEVQVAVNARLDAAP